MATSKPTNQLVYLLTNHSFLNNQLYIDINILPILCSSCAVSCRSSHCQIPASLLGFHQRNNERFHHLCLAFTEAFYYISPSTFSLVLFPRDSFRIGIHQILYKKPQYCGSRTTMIIIFQRESCISCFSHLIVYFFYSIVIENR